MKTVHRLLPRQPTGSCARGRPTWTALWLTATLASACGGLEDPAAQAALDPEGSTELDHPAHAEVATASAALTRIGNTGYGNPRAIDVCFDNHLIRSSGPTVNIPDLATVYSQLTFGDLDERRSTYVNVTFRIEHTYVGDLFVDLLRGSQVHPLAVREGGSGDVLAKTVRVNIADGVRGAWQLRIRDAASGDAGRLVSWSLEVHQLREALEPVLNQVRDDVGMAFFDTQVRFAGWRPTCDSVTGTTIRVRVRDATDGGGNSNIGPGRVNIPIHESVRHSWTWIHEFGHAMGLGHEHWNPLSTCNAETKDPNYNAATPSDPDSAMSYCASKGGVAPREMFTDLDRLVINKKYGAPGYFYRSPSGYVIRMTYDGQICHVRNPAQLTAFNIASVIQATSTEYSAFGYPDCSWPDGMYRETGSGAYRFILDGTICHLDTMDKVTAYGGSDERIEVSGENLFSGIPALTNRGVCGWPSDGFFRVPGQADVIRVSAGAACTVRPVAWAAFTAQGFRALNASNSAAGVPVPVAAQCLFPDGDYRNTANAAQSYNLNRGSWYCRYENASHLASRRSVTVDFTSANPADPNSPLHGRQSASNPICVWGWGIYNQGGTLVVMPWDDDGGFCTLRNQAEANAYVSRWPEYGPRNQTITPTSDSRVGRVNRGLCFP